tara:strand:- start:66 stop:272 length:207 start_codon:yes stop_codon:yes gene_type:complete
MKYSTKGLAHRIFLPTMHRSYIVAGWSSLVARQAHNLKVAGSNPAPAPNFGLIRSCLVAVPFFYAHIR